MHPSCTIRNQVVVALGHHLDPQGHPLGANRPERCFAPGRNHPEKKMFLLLLENDQSFMTSLKILSFFSPL